MSPKVRKLLVACAFVAAIVLSSSFGVAVERRGLIPSAWIEAWTTSAAKEPEARSAKRTVDRDGKSVRGNFKPARARATAALDEDRAAQLTALGYLQGYQPASDGVGVQVLDAERAYDGLTLLCSGHAPIAYLLSLDGRIVHQWEIAFEEVWPDGVRFHTKARQREYFRRVHVYPNGDLLAIFDYIGLVKLDKDSNLLWKTTDQNHHDVTVGPDGTIVSVARQKISARRAQKRFPGYSVPRSGVLDDVIIFLDSSGKELNRVSLLEAFVKSDYASLLPNKLRQGEPFHLNSVFVIDRDLPHLGIGAGEILISTRHLNTIATVDPVTHRITWALTGQWRGQHQASLLDNGNILLFDNRGGNAKEPFRRDQSKLVEVNPASQEIVWRYQSSKEAPLYTHFLGYVQRLPNGNTLATESWQGRVIEVAQDGTIVWEYLSPHRAGENDELVALALGAQRIPEDELTFLPK